MADKPTGPVKPPTLDLTARKTAAGPDKAEKPAPPPQPAPAAPEPDKKPAAAAAPKEAPKPAAPKKEPAPALPLGALAITGIGGAALGLAAAYGLALAGFWPTAQEPSLTALETRLARAENALQLANASVSRLDDHIQSLADAPSPELPQLPENLLTAEAIAPIESRIEALGLRIDAVAAGIPADESAELTQEIARLGAGIADIETRLDQPDTALETLDAGLAALATRIETLEAQAATQASVDAIRAERDRFARLPAATAALEAAIAAGRPFGGELAAIEALVPELGLSNPVRAIAASGVRPSRDIARDFRGAIPALLAAKPQDPEAGWLDTLLDQAQSAIALRPVDDAADTPEALVGRIEAALETGDATAARALILNLPEPMQAAATPVRADLDAVIAAQALVADIRALAPEAGQ